MASVAKCGSGYRIIFNGPDGERKAIRLPGFNKRTALAVKVRVEELVQATMANGPLARDCAAWLSGVGDELYAKLAKVGLVEARRRMTVAEWFGQWIERKRSEGLCGGTLTKIRVDTADFIGLFGDMGIEAIAPEHGQRLIDHLRARGIGSATLHKRLQRTRQALGDAVKSGLLDKNPLQHVRVSAGNPSERRAYIPTADALRCIEAAPNVHWRLLIALARFAGLRTPSEPFSLKWEHVDWERNRLTVESPKGRAGGKPYRTIPIFSALRPYLAEAWELAPEGAVHVFPESWRQRAQGPNGWINANMRTTFRKIVLRAGLTPWPRLWHNLRASCESDLAARFPLALVTKWFGNTPSVALRHYVDPTDSAYEQAATIDPFETATKGENAGEPEAEKAARQAARATSKTAARQAAQSTSVHIGNEKQSLPNPLRDCGILPNIANVNPCGIRTYVPPRGLEPLFSD